MKSFNEFQEKYQQIFSRELIHYIDYLFKQNNTNLKEIFYYHLGLDDDSHGKRIRPFLLLMATEGAGGDWEKAIPAAIAVELIHNFSLIHDDIEDNGPVRRGKPAVWQKWGLAQGVNSGDAMFASALFSISFLEHDDKQLILDVQKTFFQTCLELTYGQQMDIGFSGRSSIQLNEYFQMIQGKTAALLACCMKTGALLGGRRKDECDQYARFGRELGVAFQIFDDYLGIWGEEAATGKSTSSDLAEKKVSFPVIIALKHSPKFKKAWKSEGETNSTSQMVQWLDEDGIQEYVKKEYETRTVHAIEILEKITCRFDIKEAIKDLTLKLITRKN